jgi:hypothetical protein
MVQKFRSPDPVDPPEYSGVSEQEKQSHWESKLEDAACAIENLKNQRGNMETVDAQLALILQELLVEVEFDCGGEQLATQSTLTAERINRIIRKMEPKEIHRLEDQCYRNALARGGKSYTGRKEELTK